MNKVLIVGLGLIGGSYARCLTKANIDVYAITKNIEDINYAKENGIIKDGYAYVSKDIVSKFDRIIMCLYPTTMLEWIKEYHSYISKGTIITDVSGVKADIIYQIQDLLGEDIEFFGSHPMAGKELSGIENSDISLFKDANFIATPTNKNTINGFNFLEEIYKCLGFKRMAFLTPDKHDKMIAFLSQLTHAIAISLMNSNSDYKNLSLYTGDSFRDLTRIANINEDMWSELFLLNKKELINSIDNFIKELSTIRTKIEKDKVDDLKKLMKKSTYRRKFFNKVD